MNTVTHMNDLISFIENNWGLKYIKVTEVLQKNEEREVYLVSSGGDSFVLKIFHTEQAKNSINKYTGVLVFLMQSEFKYAPMIFKTLSGDYIAYEQGSPAYLMEYIKGVEVSENEDEEYKLGALLAQLHKLQGCPVCSDIDTEKHKASMLTRFGTYPFKAEYDSVVKNLPDFSMLKQSFIHTDVCPKNAIKQNNGEIYLIDFDEAGIGSTYIDLGYPLITQFVQFAGRKAGGMVPDINKLEFHYNEAKAFYNGYFSISPMPDDEKMLIFDGAVFMQLLYMPVFGDDAVPYMWRILTFALDNKPLLLSALGI